MGGTPAPTTLTCLPSNVLAFGHSDLLFCWPFGFWKRINDQGTSLAASSRIQLSVAHDHQPSLHIVEGPVGLTVYVAPMQLLRARITKRHSLRDRILCRHSHALSVSKTWGKRPWVKRW